MTLLIFDIIQITRRMRIDRHTDNDHHVNADLASDRRASTLLLAKKETYVGPYQLPALSSRQPHTPETRKWESGTGPGPSSP
jgi:hypothetical protein